MTHEEMLTLHKEMVGIVSVSGREGELRDFVARRLESRGIHTRRIGRNLVVVAGEGPEVLWLDTHLDTVPPASGWTRDPFAPVVEDGRVYGLGSNDAKASCAAMLGATVRLVEGGMPEGLRLVLALVAGEETGGEGTREVLQALTGAGLGPDAVVVGEPTGLDVAVAQKGRMLLELKHVGKACHAANARALGFANPVMGAAEDLLALYGAELGPEDPVLGSPTLEPTTIVGGTADNVVPAEVTCTIDIRTNPGMDPAGVLQRLDKLVSGSLEMSRTPCPSCSVDPDSRLVRAALAARPGAGIIGSRGLSDWVYFQGIPGIKVGPGRTERSHSPDEYVHEDEIVEAAGFYVDLVQAYAAMEG